MVEQVVSAGAALVNNLAKAFTSGLTLAHTHWHEIKGDNIETLMEQHNAMVTQDFEDLMFEDSNGDKYYMPPIFVIHYKSASDEEVDAEDTTSSNKGKNKTHKTEKHSRIEGYDTYHLDDKLRTKLTKAATINHDAKSSNVASSIQKFRNLIKSVINEFIIYHDKRKNPITKNVICYFLLALLDHCLKFTGNKESELEFLDRLCLLINNFATAKDPKNPEKTDRFIELNNIRSILKAAQNELRIYHKMEEPILKNQNILSKADDYSTVLMHAYLQLLFPNESPNKIDKISPEDILNGSMSELLSDKNIFHAWIKTWAKDWHFSRDDEFKVEDEHDYHFNLDKFQFGEKEDYSKINKILDANIYIKLIDAYKEEEKTHSQRKVRRQSTTELSATGNRKSTIEKREDSNSKSKNTTSQTQANTIDPKEALEGRAKIYLSLIRLLDLFNTLTRWNRLYDHNSKNARDSYILHPENNYFIITIITRLNEILKGRQRKVDKAFETLERATDGHMQRYPIQRFICNMHKNIHRLKNDFIYDIVRLVEMNNTRYAPIKPPHYKKKSKRSLPPPTLDTEHYPDLREYIRIAIGYKLRTGYPITDDIKSEEKRTHRRGSSTMELGGDFNFTPDDTPGHSQGLTPKQHYSVPSVTQRLENSKSKSEKSSANRRLSFSNTNGHSNAHADSLFKDIDETFNTVSEQLSDKSYEYKFYQDLIRDLKKQYKHAQEMLNEETEGTRKEKGDEDIKFIEKLVKYANQHMLKERSLRENLLSTFCDDMHKELDKPATLFLDKPTDPWKKRLKSSGEALLCLGTCGGYVFFKGPKIFKTSSRRLTIEAQNTITKYRKKFRTFVPDKKKQPKM